MFRQFSRENTLDKENILIRNYIDGDKKAFEKLIKIYEPEIKRMLFVLLNGNFEDIKDVSQNILISLYQSLSNFRFNCSFKTYLYRFVRNKAIDFIKKQKQVTKINEKFKKNNSNIVSNVEFEYLCKESKIEFYRYLYLLKEDERIYIYLKDIEDKSIKEISDIMKKKIGSVKSNIHRARNKLYKILKENEYEYMQ